MTTTPATGAELLPTPAMAELLGISTSNLRRQRHKFSEGVHYVVRRGLSPVGEIRWIPEATEVRAEELRSGARATTAPLPVEVTA